MAERTAEFASSAWPAIETKAGHRWKKIEEDKFPTGDQAGNNFSGKFQPFILKLKLKVVR